MSVHSSAFTLSSPDFEDGDYIHLRHVMTGEPYQGDNLSPALQWDHVPEGTQSFAVTVYDPDAPTGSGWWHWLVFNLPADTRSLPRGALPDGAMLPAGAVQSITDFGVPGYGGPRPPKGHGAHRYQFTVFALKVPTLDLPADTMPAKVGFMLNANALGTAKITALFRG